MYIGLNNLGLNNLGNNFSPLSLFSASQQGVWYDPSDFSTMYQDSIGTTPVTAVEQPVGLLLDKSGRGNHAIQATSANRPVLSAKYNLFTGTENIFNGPSWSLSGGGVASVPVITGNFATAPDGTQTAIRIQLALNGGSTLTDFAQVTCSTLSMPVITGAVYAQTAWFKATNFSNVGKVVVWRSTAGAAFTQITLTADWQKATLNETGNSVVTSANLVSLRGTTGSSDSADVLVWHPDLRTTADAALKIPAYQRVNTSTDYDTVGFPYYLTFNGTNSSLVTGSIDFTGTAQLTMFSGVCKPVENSSGTIEELSTAGDANPGAFFFRASAGNAANYQWNVRSATTNGQATPVATAPDVSVLTLTTDLTAPLLVSRRNGVQTATGAVPAGGGNFGNYPLYIGARAGTSLFFNGRVYSLMIRGATSSAVEISNAENWVNSKTGGVY